MVTVVDTTASKRTGAARHPEKAARPDTPVLRKPDWIRVKAPGSAVYNETRNIVRQHGLHTVCEEAGCPNIGECWSQRHATMMIMGDTCTRACSFCNVATGRPNPLDPAEPRNVGEAVAKLGLNHVVITSVDRDRHILGLVRIERQWQAGAHIAEGAGARADLAHDHEGGVLLLPALADIGAPGLLAHRHQPVLARDAARVRIAARARRLDADPVRLAQYRRVGPRRLLGVAGGAGALAVRRIQNRDHRALCALSRPAQQDGRGRCRRPPGFYTICQRVAMQ